MVGWTTVQVVVGIVFAVMVVGGSLYLLRHELFYKEKGWRRRK